MKGAKYKNFDPSLYYASLFAIVKRGSDGLMVRWVTSDILFDLQISAQDSHK